MSRCITPEGYETLRAELEHLWRVERPKVTKQVSDAAALGDRSENAEYIYGKKRLREIDRRLGYLTKLLDEVTVVRQAPDNLDRAYFGAWVTLEDEDGELRRYRLVGPDEFDLKLGKISIDAPMGKALLGRTIGEEVPVDRPKGRSLFTVIDIQYDPITPTG